TQLGNVVQAAVGDEDDAACEDELIPQSGNLPDDRPLLPPVLACLSPEGTAEHAEGVLVPEEGLHVFQDVNHVGIVPQQLEESFACETAVGELVGLFEPPQRFLHGVALGRPALAPQVEAGGVTQGYALSTVADQLELVFERLEPFVVSLQAALLSSPHRNMGLRGV